MRDTVCASRTVSDRNYTSGRKDPGQRSSACCRSQAPPRPPRRGSMSVPAAAVLRAACCPSRRNPRSRDRSLLPWPHSRYSPCSRLRVGKAAQTDHGSPLPRLSEHLKGTCRPYPFRPDSAARRRRARMPHASPTSDRTFRTC